MIGTTLLNGYDPLSWGGNKTAIVITNANDRVKLAGAGHDVRSSNYETSVRDGEKRAGAELLNHWIITAYKCN